MTLPAAVAPLFFTHDSTQPQCCVKLPNHVLLYHPDALATDDYERLVGRAITLRCVHCASPWPGGRPVPVCVDWQRPRQESPRVHHRHRGGCHFPCALRAALAQAVQTGRAKQAMHQLVSCLAEFPAPSPLSGPLDKHSLQVTAQHNVRTHAMEYSLTAMTATQGEALPQPTPAAVDGGPSPIFSPAPDRHALFPFGGPLKTNAADACFVQRPLDAPPLVRSVTGNQAPALLEGSLPVHDTFLSGHECVIRHPNLARDSPHTLFRQQAWTGLCCLHCTSRIKHASHAWPVITATANPAHLGIPATSQFVFTATPGVLCSPACHRAYIQQHMSLAAAPAAKTAMALYVHQTLGKHPIQAAPPLASLQAFGGTNTAPDPVPHQATETVYIALTCYHVTPAHCPPSVVHKVATQAMQVRTKQAATQSKRAPKGTSIAEKQAARLTLAHRQSQLRAHRIPTMLQIPEDE